MHDMYVYVSASCMLIYMHDLPHVPDTLCCFCNGARSVDVAVDVDVVTSGSCSISRNRCVSESEAERVMLDRY